MAALSRGFSLIELTIVIGILAMLALGTIPYLESQRQIARAHKTAAEMKTWLESAMAFYTATNAWPADQNVMVVGGYMNASDLINPWGNVYTARPVGGSFEVSTTFTMHPNIGVEKLPNAVAVGSVVTARVVVPGTETAHTRLLNRYGDAGQNTMMAPLDMNANPMDNAVSINVTPGSRLSVQGGDIDIRNQTNILTNNFGLITKDASGAQNIAAESQAGSIEANDIFLRSLSGNQWLSQRFSRFVLKDTYVVSHGEIVPKPTCTGGIPRIYIIPQLTQMGLSGITGYGSALVKALDLGASWQAVSLNFTGAGAVPGGPGLAQTYCYF